MIAAVKNRGWVLSYASAELKNEVVLAAANQRCGALAYASTELKNNKDFVLV